MSEKLRLLVCKTCSSVQELPDFEGPAMYDEWLSRIVKEHEGHIAAPLARVEVSDWQKQSAREEIIRKLFERFQVPGKGEGMGSEYYDLKSTFLDDAYKCWKSFNRTTNPGHCDYKKENKRLLPDTKALRKEEGMSTKDRPSTFLCDFCPVHSIVLQKNREALGMYK